MMLKKLKHGFANKQVQEIAILVALFLFSMAVRRIGVKHGFPLLTHPDEDAILYPVYEMTRNRTLNPGVFKRPNQILYLINFLYLNVLSSIRFGENLAATFFRHEVLFHYYGRILIMVFGSLVPIVAYKIGQGFKAKFALAAGLVFAIFPLYTEQSLYITPDIPITLFTLLVMYFTLRYLKHGGEHYIYLAVFFAAVNTAEKYPGIISLAIVFLGLLLKSLDKPSFSWQKDTWPLIKKCVLVLLVFVGLLFLVAPYLFIEFDLVRAAINREAQETHPGADNLGWGGNMLFYLRTFGDWSNLLAVLWIGIGIYALVKWKDKHALVLLYGALYWVVLSRLPLHWERWALPMYITPLFLIAIGITTFWDVIKDRPKLRLLAVLIVLFIAQQFIATIQTAVVMSFTDTRLAASIFTHDNGIRTDNSIYEGYSPLLPHKPKNISPIDFRANPDAEFVILSSFMFERYYAEPERYADKIELYEAIKTANPLIKTFEPSAPANNALERMNDILFYVKNRLNLAAEERFKGPTILIFQIAE